MTASPLPEPVLPVKAAAWEDSGSNLPLPFWSNLAADVVAHYNPAKAPRSVWDWMMGGFRVVLGSSCFHTVLLYRLAPGRRLARHHESWVYFWYKHDHRTLAAPRLLALIVRARVKSLLRHRQGLDTMRAVGSLVGEIGAMLVRLPFWELKYRQRFLIPPTR